MYLILPAYNEEESLPALLRRVAGFSTKSGIPVHTIVVDDGSRDATVQVAETDPGDVQVIRHAKNQGLGAAVKTGLQAACEMSTADDLIAMMDADNTHDPDLLSDMKRRLENGFDVVIASRYAPGGREVGLALPRRMGSRMVSRTLRTLFPIPGARDYTCGFRLYRSSIVRRAFDTYADDLITETSFVCMAELLVKLHSVGARVTESPLVLRYDFKKGESKMRIVRTLGRYWTFATSQRRRIFQIRKEFGV